MIKHLNTIAILIFISWFLFKMIWNLWTYHGYIFKEGDPITAPHYKKTLYYNKKLITDYDFYPFFDKIRKNLEKDKTIDYYQWILYYDSSKRLFYKAELLACYKIGVKTCKLRFQTKNNFFVDKTQTIHLCIDLILARRVENILAGEIYIQENKNSEKNNDILMKLITISKYWFEN